jgi:hypothetical protein
VETLGIQGRPAYPYGIRTQVAISLAAGIAGSRSKYPVFQFLRFTRRCTGKSPMAVPLSEDLRFPSSACNNFLLQLLHIITNDCMFLIDNTER